MFKSLHSRARTVATTGLIAALVVAGLAVAQNGGGSGDGNGGKARQGQPPSGKRMPPPPGGPLGKVGKDLTYGQLHVQRNGEDQVIRIDAGELVTVGDSSITVKENDGNEVTVEVDEKTKVLAGPGRNTSVTDLEQGQHVIVCGPEGEAAKTIAVPPKRGRMPSGPRGSQQGPQGAGRDGQLPPPPPGGQFGGQQGGPGQMQG